MKVRIKAVGLDPTSFLFTGDEKWVSKGGRLDIYKNGVLGRDSLLHDHEGVNAQGEAFRVSREAARSRATVKDWAIRREAEAATLRSAGVRFSRLSRRGGVSLGQLSKTVSALEARNASLSAKLTSIRPLVSQGKWVSANAAVQQASAAAHTARAMTERAMQAERLAKDAGMKAARASAEVAAQNLRLQAEAAAKSAKASAEAASKTAREAAEAAAKTGRIAAETTVKTLRSASEAAMRTLRTAAEAAAKTARAAAEAAVRAARVAAEATARAAAATGKAVVLTAAAVASAVLR